MTAQSAFARLVKRNFIRSSLPAVFLLPLRYRGGADGLEGKGKNVARPEVSDFFLCEKRADVFFLLRQCLTAEVDRLIPVQILSPEGFIRRLRFVRDGASNRARNL